MKLADGIEIIRGDYSCKLGGGNALADSVITDPPYGTTDCSWDVVRKGDLSRMWDALNPVTKPASVFALFAAQPFTTDLINSNRKNFRYDLVWEKTTPVGFLNANRQPLRTHETICIFCARPSLSVYHPQKVPCAPRKTKTTASTVYSFHRPVERIQTGYHPRSVLRFQKDWRKHPTAKPVALVEFLIRSYTNPGDLVLDPFMGSGTTGIACINTGRRFLGIELDPVFFKMAARRIREALKVKAAA